MKNNIKEIEKELNKIPEEVIEYLNKIFKNVKIRNTSFPIIFDVQLTFTFQYEIEELNIKRLVSINLIKFAKDYKKKKEIQKLKESIIIYLKNNIEDYIIHYFIRGESDE